ncbi:MAG: hypothetical protein ACRDBO_11500 [Lachnospiraceae bacterium]
MNRTQRRKQPGKKSLAGLADATQAQRYLDNLPLNVLIASINNSIDVLHRRGVKVCDWDCKERELYQLRMYAGKVFFLAAPSDGDIEAKEGGAET